MTETQSMNPTPDNGGEKGPDYPTGAAIKYAFLFFLIAALAALCYFVPAYKKTVADLKVAQSTKSQGVTIYRWENVGGKAYPVTVFETSSEASTLTASHQETVEKRGGAIGLEAGAVWSTDLLKPRTIVGLSVDVLTVPILGIPLRAGLYYEPNF